MISTGWSFGWAGLRSKPRSPASSMKQIFKIHGLLKSYGHRMVAIGSVAHTGSTIRVSKQEYANRLNSCQPKNIAI